MSHSRSRSRSMDRTLERLPSRSRSISINRDGSTSRPRSAKIVIEKLTKNVQEQHLREIFGAYGEIDELELPKNAQFMTNKGIAYIMYAQPSCAEHAVSAMHDGQLDGAMIACSIVLPKRRFSRSPPPARPPPDRFGEPHRLRQANRGFGPPDRAPYARRNSPPPPRRGRGGGGGYRDRYDDRYDDRRAYRPRTYSPSRSPPPRRRGRSSSRSQSPSRTPPRRRGASPRARYGRDRSPSRTPPRRLDRSPPRGGGRRRGSYSHSNHSYGSRTRSPSLGPGGRR